MWNQGTGGSSEGLVGLLGRWYGWRGAYKGAKNSPVMVREVVRNSTALGLGLVAGPSEPWGCSANTGVHKTGLTRSQSKLVHLLR